MHTYTRPLTIEVDQPSTLPFDLAHLDREQFEQMRRSDLTLVSFNDGLTKCIKDRYGPGRGRTVPTNSVDPTGPFRGVTVMRGSSDTLVPQA